MRDQPRNCGWKQEWLLGLLLIAMVFLVYQPSWNGEAVYDDSDHLTSPELQSVTGLGRIWTELGVVSQYYPVTHSVFWLEHKLWGDAMLGYHLANILLHAFCALLLVAVMKRLEIPGAWLAAWIFALHPVMVESVAWISELKNTLSTVFYLGAALTYLEFDRTRRRKFFAIALTLFIGGLLSKSVVASLPAALLLVFWWQRGRLFWKQDVLPLLPFFLVGIFMGLLTAWMEQTFIGAKGDNFDFTLVERGLIAGRVIWFYLGKLFWPANLILIYPRWHVSSSVAWQYLFPAAALLLVAGLWALRQQWRGPLAAMLFFVGTLFPVLGFLNVYPFRYSFVADHYQYLASLGVIVAVSAGVVMLLDRWQFRARTAGNLLCIAFVAVLAGLSWRQAGLYSTAETLWRTTIARNPACFLAYSNLSTDLLPKGRVDEAIQMGEKALEIESGYAEPHNSLANALRQKGRVDEALQHYQKALEIRPDLAPVHCNVGYILLQKGRLDEAMACFRKAVELRPEFVKAHVSLANVLLQKGRLDEAITHLRTALKILPDDAEAHSNLGNALLQKREFDDAIVYLQKALRVQPDNAMAHDDLGNAFLQKGRVDEAMAHYQQALALQPNFDMAHYNFGCALLQKGEVDQAIIHFQKALDLQPALMAGHYQLGNALLEKGRTDEAIVCYQKALELQPDFVDAHVNLAGALLQKGRVTEVLAHSRAALKLQPENPSLLASLAWLLATWHEPAVRNGPEAMQLASRANQITGGKDAMTLRALAAAYAESGRFSDAIMTSQQALRLANLQNNAEVANFVRAELTLYQTGKPVRVP